MLANLGLSCFTVSTYVEQEVVMKNQILIFILILFSTLLFSQVNFELDFSFEKTNPDDGLTNLQLFDYDDNGIEDVVISYKSDVYNNCWRIICYSQTGSVLEEFFQENNEDEFFQKGYILKNNEITYLLATFIYRSGVFLEEVYLRVKVFDFESGSLICEQDYLIGVGQSDETYISYSINTSDIIHQILSTDEIIFYIGTKHHKSTHTTQVDTYTYRDKSIIYKFLLSNNDITFIEEIENAGERIIVYNTYDWLLCTGMYYFHDWSELEDVESKSRHYRINLVTPELQSQVQEVYHIHGSYNNWFGDEIYENYPHHFKVLTNNDLYFINYGLIAYNIEYDTNVGTSIHFTNFSTDFADSLWVKGDSYIGDNQITSSTCISVNNEDHYVMYFRGNQLEIRDRINGNIIHYQNSSFSPFEILRKFDGELLFFVEQEDETGYDVYVLESEIQVSADENELPIKNYELQNHPNPFNPSTTISFSIEQNQLNELIEINIFNVKGQRVKSLHVILNVVGHRIEGRGQSNQYSITWRGTDQNTNPVSSGIYFYQLKVDGEVKQTKKMILLK